MEQQNNIPADLKVTVNYLRSKAGLKTKTGVLNGKRHEYFKGKHALKTLLTPAYAKIHPSTLPPCTDAAQATQLLHSIIPFAYFLRVDRSDQSIAGAKLIQINPMQLFSPDHYYTWLWEGSQVKTILGGVLMVAVILAGVMFPLWPASLRIGVWYLSIGVLGLIGVFFGIAIVRLILWVVTWFAASPGIWLFPNLFEDVGFVDSFIPLWAWDYPPPKKSEKKRAEKLERAAEKEQKRAAKQAKRLNAKGAGDSSTSGAATPLGSNRIEELASDED